MSVLFKFNNLWVIRQPESKNVEENLNFQVSLNKNSETKVLEISSTNWSMQMISLDSPYNRSYYYSTDFDMDDISEEESWVVGSGESVIFGLDMHPDFGDPI